MIFGKIEISAFRIFQNGFYPHIWSTHQPQSIHSRLLSEKFVLQLWICLWFIVISCVYAPNKNWKLEMATDARIAITFTCTLDKVFHVMYVWAVFFSLLLFIRNEPQFWQTLTLTLPPLWLFSMVPLTVYVQKFPLITWFPQLSSSETSSTWARILIVTSDRALLFFVGCIKIQI